MSTLTVRNIKDSLGGTTDSTVGMILNHINTWACVDFPDTLRDTYNVTSITDNATGDKELNLTSGYRRSEDMQTRFSVLISTSTSASLVNHNFSGFTASVIPYLTYFNSGSVAGNAADRGVNLSVSGYRV